MNKLYLITGATGHVGTVLVSELLNRNEHVRILVLPNHADRSPAGVEVCTGSITEEKSLIPFFIGMIMITLPLFTVRQ